MFPLNEPLALRGSGSVRWRALCRPVLWERLWAHGSGRELCIFPVTSRIPQTSWSTPNAGRAGRTWAMWSRSSGGPSSVDLGSDLMATYSSLCLCFLLWKMGVRMKWDHVARLPGIFASHTAGDEGDEREHHHSHWGKQKCPGSLNVDAVFLELKFLIVFGSGVFVRG